MKQQATREKAGDKCPYCGYEYGHSKPGNHPVLTLYDESLSVVGYECPNCRVRYESAAGART
jgi:rubredoxin